MDMTEASQHKLAKAIRLYNSGKNQKAGEICMDLMLELVNRSD